MSAFDPADVPETNFTSYPEPHRAVNQNRYNRRLGDHAGLRNFGVNLTRIVPGGQSSYRHAHSRQDEFIFVLTGEVVLETNGGLQTLTAGMCAGFPAGCGDAHRFVNRSADDALLLVIGIAPRKTRLPTPMWICMRSSRRTVVIDSARRQAIRYDAAVAMGPATQPRARRTRCWPRNEPVHGRPVVAAPPSRRGRSSPIARR